MRHSAAFSSPKAFWCSEVLGHKEAALFKASGAKEDMLFVFSSYLISLKCVGFFALWDVSNHEVVQ